ncbi:helicase SRCAP isoform X2 [Ambystoma mexicanum]
MSVINILMQLRKVCNHPNLFDPRPIHSPFITEGICFTTASLVLHALEKDPFKHVDLDIFDLINLEGRVSRYEADIFLPKRKTSRLLIEEIAESPDPPPRPKPVKMKVNRMFQPVPKPEGRPVVMVNSPRATGQQRLPVLAMTEMMETTVAVNSAAHIPPVIPVQPNILVPPVSVSPVVPVSLVPDTPQVLLAALPAQLPLANTTPILTAALPLVQPPTAFVPALSLNTSAATTTVTSLLGPVSTPQVLPSSQIQPNTPRPPVPLVTTPNTPSAIKANTLSAALVRTPTSTLNQGPIGGVAKPAAGPTASLPGYSFSAGGQVQQRLLLAPDMQARLPSGEVISIAQLASLANRPIQNIPGTKPITFQLHGNRLTLSGTNLRQVTMGQPRQLQGNVVHLVSAGGQHHIISQPAHMALLQAMTQQQQLQQSAQAQVGVQSMSLQAVPMAHQSAVVPNCVPSVIESAAASGCNIPYSAAQASMMNSSGMVKIVVRQTPRDPNAPPSISVPQKQAALPTPGIPTLISSMQRGTVSGTPLGPGAVRFPAPIRTPNPQPTMVRPMLRVLHSQAPSIELSAAGTTLCSVPQTPTTAPPFASMPATSATNSLGARILTSASNPVSIVASQPMVTISSSTLNLPCNSIQSSLPQSLIAFSSPSTSATQPLSIKPTLVQIPTCSLATSPASRPSKATTLLTNTSVMSTSSSPIPLPNSDSYSAAMPSVSLRRTDNTALTPSLWPLTSTAPILVSSQFSSPVPILSPAQTMGTAPMIAPPLVSTSTYIQSSNPSSSLMPHTGPIQTSCSLPVLASPHVSNAASTVAYNHIPILSPSLTFNSGPVLAPTCTNPAYLQAVPPSSSPGLLLAPGQVTSSAINRTSSPIHLQTSLLAPLRSSLATPLQASIQTTNPAPLVGSSSALLPSCSLAANLLPPCSASSFACVQCPSTRNSDTRLAPVLASSPTQKVVSITASGSASMVATLVSPNIPPLLASTNSSSHPSLLASISPSDSTLPASVPTFLTASLVTSNPAALQTSVPASSPTPMMASAPGCSPAAMQSVTSSSPVPMQTFNPASISAPLQKPGLSTNSVAMLGARSFTLVSNPVPTCLSLEGSCPTPAQASTSNFTSASMPSTQTSVTSSCSLQTRMPCNFTSDSNASLTLNSVPSSTLVPIQSCSPPLSSRSLIQGIPLIGAKSGVSTVQSSSLGLASIASPLPVPAYGFHLDSSASNQSTRPAQIPSQATAKGLISVSSNEMHLACSAPNRSTRSALPSAQIPIQCTVHSFGSMPSNGVHLACPSSTVQFPPSMLQPNPSDLVSSLPASLPASIPVSGSTLEQRITLSSSAATLTGPLATSFESVSSTLALRPMAVSSCGASLTKPQPVYNPLATAPAALSLTSGSSPLSNFVAQPSSSLLSTLPTSVPCQISQSSSLFSNSAGQSPTPVNSLFTSSACQPLTQVSTSAATFAEQPLIQVNSCFTTLAEHTLAPDNINFTTSSCRPLTAMSSSASALGNPPLTQMFTSVTSRSPTPLNNFLATLASNPLTQVSSSATMLSTPPQSPFVTSFSTVGAQSLAAVLNPVTTLVHQPLMSISSIALTPLPPVSSCLTTSAARPLTPIPSVTPASAAQTVIPVSSTMLTLTPRTQSCMVFKEELETLTLGSTVLTPPPSSASFVVPRPRRQPPPPPRSPFYLESLEKKRKRQKQDRLDRLFRINERHCGLSPVYGTEILQLCNLSSGMACKRRDGWWGVGYAHCFAAQVLSEFKNVDVFWQVTGALRQALLGPQQRMEQLEHLLDRFIFVMPPVEAPTISVHTCHPPPSLTVQQVVFKETLRHELAPRCHSLHRVLCNMRTQFPDLRLIQYDCGKLQTLDRLLRQLKAGNHRVLIFTQMTRMLDVLEQFLNYHGHIYLRLDGSTRVEQRQSLMDRFNADKRIFCFILSTRSGGVGVNLTGADTVIFYDSDWNPTMDAQAQDRCHRIGQTRDVHIYRLISERTVEENILKKANQKRMLGDMAIEGGNFTTAFFQQQTIRDLFEMPTDEVPKKEGDVTFKAFSQEEVDLGPTKQSQILEQALCKAEDEEDIRAATQAKAEQVAELAEFNENIPLDADDGPGKEEEEEMSKAEQEIASLVEQLTPIERYAMNFLETSLEDISKEELKHAEEQVEAARKDLDQAKDEILHLPGEEEEDWLNEEIQSKRSRKPKAFNRPERPGTRVSERLRGTRLSGMEGEEPGAIDINDHHLTGQEAKRLSLENPEKMQPILETPALQELQLPLPVESKLLGATRHFPHSIPEKNESLQRSEADHLIHTAKQVSESETVLSREQLTSISHQKNQSALIPEQMLKNVGLLHKPLNMRTLNSGQLQSIEAVLRKVPALQAKCSPPKVSLSLGESILHSTISQNTLRPQATCASKPNQLAVCYNLSHDADTLLKHESDEGAQGSMLRRNEDLLQNADSRGLSLVASKSVKVGEGAAVTKEVKACLLVVPNEATYYSEATDKPEKAEKPVWADLSRRGLTEISDRAELPVTFSQTEMVPFETLSDNETKALGISCSHQMQTLTMNKLYPHIGQVATELSFHMNTSSQDTSVLSQPSEQHSPRSLSHKSDSHSMITGDTLLSSLGKPSSENFQEVLGSIATPSHICGAQNLGLLLQSKDGSRVTEGDDKQSPMLATQPQSIEMDPSTDDLLKQISNANHNAMALPCNIIPQKSTSSVEVKSNCPTDDLSPNCKESRAEGADIPIQSDLADKEAMTPLDEEMKTALDCSVSANASSSPGVCVRLLETQSLLHRPTLGLETMDSQHLVPLKDSMECLKKGGPIGDINSLPDKELSRSVIICKEEEKTEHIFGSIPKLQDGSILRLGFSHPTPGKESFDGLALHEVDPGMASVSHLTLPEAGGKECIEHQHLNVTPERMAMHNSSEKPLLEAFITDEEEAEVKAERLESPPRTPRRRTNADGEILQSQKEDDSPTAKVLRKLPGRIMTIVEDRVPLKRKRKSNHPQNSMPRPDEGSTNCIFDTDTAGTVVLATRKVATRSKIGPEAKHMRVQQKKAKKDLPKDYEQADQLLQSLGSVTVVKDEVCDAPTTFDLSQDDSVKQLDARMEAPVLVLCTNTDNQTELDISAESQERIQSPVIKRKRGRPRKTKLGDSLDYKSPDSNSPDSSSLELSSPGYRTPEPVLPAHKSPEQVPLDKPQQSSFSGYKSAEMIYPGCTSQINSPLQESTQLSSIGLNTDSMESANRAKQQDRNITGSPEHSTTSSGPKNITPEMLELKSGKETAQMKGTPDKESVVSSDPSESLLSIGKRKRGRPPKIQEQKKESSSSSNSSFFKSEKSMILPRSPSNKTLTDNALNATFFTDGVSTPQRFSTDSGSTPNEVLIDVGSTAAGVSTDASSPNIKLSTLNSSTTTAFSTDTSCTSPKRKRGRPPKMQSTPTSEQSTLPLASEQESSLDEANNLQPPAKKTNHKKRKVRAEETQWGLRLHTTTAENVTGQSQLSDSDTSSSSEAPPLTRLAKVKMEAQGPSEREELELVSNISDKVAVHNLAPIPRTDSDSDMPQLLAANRNTDLPDKSVEYSRKKTETFLLKRINDPSSQESSASEIRTPQREDIPRGRCTRQTPCESLLPALETDKRVQRKAKQQSTSDKAAMHLRARTDSEPDSTSEDDCNRLHKRPRGESERLRKVVGHSTTSESTADRILRSVAAAAAVAAMSPASNTRSSAVASPPPSTQSPTAGRKAGPLAFTTLGNKGRKPKT